MTRAPGTTAFAGSVTTPLTAEEEFWERALVGAKAAVMANIRQSVGPNSDQFVLLLHFMICIGVASKVGGTREQRQLRSAHATFSEGLGRTREWYKFRNADVKNIFY
jgi:hypothetical protein